MIVEIKKYYSDIDSLFEFYSREKAEKFERTYKPFYELNDEAEAMYDRIRVEGDTTINPLEVGKELFDRAKALLDEYVKNDRQGDKPILSEMTARNLINIGYTKEGLSYVSRILYDDDEDEWIIIGYLFDMIYCLFVMKNNEN